MHAHERTLVASMGFADPDKRDPRHDLACRYVATLECRRKLKELLGLEAEVEHPRMAEVARLRRSSLSPRFEVPITKGEGQYRTMVGFLDLVIPVLLPHRCQGAGCCVPPPPDEWAHGHIYGIAVEVKIVPIGIGDLLRQLKVYMTYHGAYLWLVVTAYPLTDGEVTVLKGEGIHHLELGPGFEAFVAAEAAERAALRADRSL